MKVHDTEVSVACRHLFRRYEARHSRHASNRSAMIRRYSEAS
jgi:hypothetical protein